MRARRSRRVWRSAPLRPLLNFTDGRVLTPIYQLMGGAPKPLVKWAFQLSSFQKMITKPLAVAARLDDADFLAQIEAVDRFTAVVPRDYKRVMELIRTAEAAGRNVDEAVMGVQS